MTLFELLSVYNFRTFLKEKENTQIVRITDELRNMWFEFGVDDWSYASERSDFIRSLFKQSLLEREVSSISYRDDIDVVSISIFDKKDDKNTPNK